MPSLGDSQHNSAEEIQIGLAPYIQHYLAQTGRRHSCCSVMLPVAFERAAPKAWWDPKFDSAILEGQYQSSVFPQLRLRFRFALLYILLCSVVWMIYFLTVAKLNSLVSIAFGLCIVLCLVTVWLTYSKFYEHRAHAVTLCVACSICLLSLLFVSLSGRSFSALGHFATCIEVILLIYTLMPLPLWQCVSISVLYSLLFEALHFIFQNFYYAGDSQEDDSSTPYRVIVVRCLLHLCVHMVGLHVLVMNVVRMRCTFMKVGQNLLIRRQLEMEKQLKEKMIHSVMPPKVADMLMKEGSTMESGQDPKRSYSLHPRLSNDVKSLFRPFHMHSMDNVSILFADIVGFTKMSTTKTAEQLVEILNDLFERFDELCMLNGCEKISTLGDCYYCVSGCPEPRADHAMCCVEMGLGMIQAVRIFDAQKNEGVKMRVGVHTGSVLCGIVGTRRVKFDVWSNDVTLANRMESTGTPEQVHISEETRKFLGDGYILKEGDEVFGHRTYFVVGKKCISMDASRSEVDVSKAGACQLLIPQFDGFTNGVQLSRSVTNLSSIQPTVPPASPIGVTSTSLTPSPILSTRPRLASLSRVTKYLTGANHAPIDVSNRLSSQRAGEAAAPTIIVTTKSLPGSLDSDQEDSCCRGSHRKTDERKYSAKLRGWRVPRFLRKTDDFPPDCDSAKKADPPLCADQNGYQQVPVVVETPAPAMNTLELPRGPTNCSPSQCSMFDDIIDVRSYISHSRSDISPFGRSGSYRSQCGRSPQAAGGEVTPAGRSRSSTMAPIAVSLQQRNCSSPWIEVLSMCPSAHSRKDSGIKSNSRRSSIHHVNGVQPALGASAQRVSGYFTSSQSSLAETPNVVNDAPYVDPLAACLQQLRKQSDLQLIRCVKENAKSQRSYLVKPPVSNVTLFFRSWQMEREFRSKAHRFGQENQGEGPPTLATPRYNTYIDLLVSVFIFLTISLSLFLLVPITMSIGYQVWVALFAVFCGIQFLAVFICSKQMIRLSRGHTKSDSCIDRLFDSVSNWYPWHICGSILMSLPVISIFLNLTTLDVDTLTPYEFHYGLLLFICVIHYCNFTQLNCWLRNSLALLAAVAFIGITIYQWHAFVQLQSQEIPFGTHVLNVTNPSANYLHEEIRLLTFYQIEIYIDLILLLFLVCFLNREYEIGYRLTFYGSAVANQDKIRVQHMKNQADMLLHNIIPKHVAEQLKNTAKYSENYHDVGIIFASIVNFNEMYDESYLGGKEYLRVLNELIGDFDELLSRPEFQCVEKIKSIGSTFMAASGLDPSTRGDNQQHLHALIEFSCAMQGVVDAFNKDLLEFNLILRIGFNIGDVTAGVIGTSKLYYDIWGDAVNVASRMDSTGVAGRIQVGKECLPHLEAAYDFEPRGSVYVKGKDNMEVYLLKGKKSFPHGES
ncbi:adenylate cyclase type 9 [Phlebotomus argentipes]|uniref:adenylate cyclase type 9 n=1 Tax=Phlebotomus argentipes TaxID=94469 RepID=UPI00289319A6|nr:adenylate cyclase type 9 [Phlebotomus argentipes]